jgi:hypothetical protein
MLRAHGNNHAHPETQAAAIELAKCLFKLKNYSEAETLFRLPAAIDRQSLAAG